jgi:hypothetical protein
MGNTYANDTLWADQLDELVLDGALGVTLAVGLEVTQVTDVTLLIGWSTVGLGVWVDCWNAVSVHRLMVWIVPGEFRLLTVRTGGSATVGVVTELVDVHATLSVGIVSGDVP